MCMLMFAFLFLKFGIAIDIEDDCWVMIANGCHGSARQGWCKTFSGDCLFIP